MTDAPTWTALLLAVLVGACAPAPEPVARVLLVRDDGPRTVSLQVVPRGDALVDARQTLRALGLAWDAGTLADPRVWTWRGRTTVSLLQRHRGVPVRGGSAAVRFDRRGRPALVHAHHVDGLTVDVTPVVGRAQAVRLMAAALPGPSSAVEPALVVVPDGRGGRLDWVGTVTTSAPPDRWRVSVNATSGEARVERASHTALGRAYPLHPAAGEPVEVTLAGLEEGSLELDSPLADVWSTVWSGKNYGESRYAAADEAGDFLFDPEPWDAPDPFAEVSAYYHVGRALGFFAERFGAGPAESVRALVNYEEAPGEGYSNAYAYQDTGGRFVTVFGHTETLDFAYSGPITAHEIGHPFFQEANDTEDHTDYPVNIDAQGFHSAPSALNEGMSDYWSGAITGDVDVMAYLSEEGGLERSLRRLDGHTRCPDDLIGEAHMDGALISTILWELRGSLGEGVDEVAWALIHQLEGAPTFADAAAIVQQNVVALVEDGVLPAGSEDVAAKVLAERGAVGCGRSVPIVAGEARKGTAIGADTVATALGMDQSLCSGLRLIGARIPLVVSYVATVPQEAIGGLQVGIELERLDEEPVGEGDVLYEVVLRRDEAAELMLVPLAYGGVSLNVVNGVAAADVVRDGSPPLLTVTTDELALEPGETIHINVLSAHCYSMRHLTTLTWLPPAPPVEPDAGTGDATDATDAGADVEAEVSADVGSDVGGGDAGGGGAADSGVGSVDSGAGSVDSGAGSLDAGGGGGSGDEGCGTSAPPVGSWALLAFALLAVRRRAGAGVPVPCQGERS